MPIAWRKSSFLLMVNLLVYLASHDLDHREHEQAWQTEGVAEELAVGLRH